MEQILDLLFCCGNANSNNKIVVYENEKRNTPTIDRFGTNGSQSTNNNKREASISRKKLSNSLNFESDSLERKDSVKICNSPKFTDTDPLYKKKLEHKIDLSRPKNQKNSGKISPREGSFVSKQSKKSIFTFHDKGAYLSNENTIIKVEELLAYSCKITNDEIKKAKKLVLEDVEGELLWNKRLTIDAGGLEIGLRKKRDGLTLFGTIAELNHKIINDFALNNSRDPNLKKQIFIIYYDKKSCEYIIKDIQGTEKDKTNIYHKLDDIKVVNEKVFFIIGHIVMSAEKVQESNSLNVDIFNMETKERKTKTFEPTDSPVTVGRKKCMITLDYSFFSRNQCTLEWNAEIEDWILYDGYQSSKSSYGTWMLVDDSIAITSNKYIKIGKNVVKISVI